jgi:hypothetical protein
MPIGSVEEPQATYKMAESFPAHVVSSDMPLGGKSIGTEHGNWRTLLFNATIGPQKLCNRSPRRKRLLLAVYATTAAQNVLDGVLLGSRDWANNSAAIVSPYIAGVGAGGFIPIGQSLRWECQSELWAVFMPANTQPVLVTVCDEQYASD